jgi:hypothetical protein
MVNIHCRTVVVYFWSFCFCFGILGFELRASHLQGKCCTTWTMPPALFFLLYLFFRVSQTGSSSTSWVARIPAAHYHAWYINWDGVLLTFVCPCQLWTKILQFSASQVAGITDLRYHTWLPIFLSKIALQLLQGSTYNRTFPCFRLSAHLPHTCYWVLKYA